MAVTHRSLSIAIESSFGSLDSSTGLPSTSGLTYISIPCERDPIVIYGDVVASERTDARDGAFGVPAEPDTVWASGSRVRRRTGSIECRVDLTTIGTAANTYDANYLGYLLGAGLLTKTPSQTSDTASAIASVNKYTPTSAPAVADIGTLIGADLSGRAEYSAITDNDVSGDVTISPALSANFTGTPTIRHLQTWYPGTRDRSGTKTHSVAFQVNGVDFKTDGFGCVLESISISLDSGRLMADLVYQAAIIQDDHAAATGPVEPSYNTGAPAFFRGAYVVVSSTAPSSLTDPVTGDALARTGLNCEDFSFTLTNTLTPKGHSNSILAMSEMEISDIDVELTLTLSAPNTSLDQDYFNRQLRQVLVGTGPVGDGLGCAIMIPCAYLNNDPSKYEVGGNDIVRQTLTYKQSRYNGDFDTGVSSPYNSNAGNSFLRIGLGI